MTITMTATADPTFTPPRVKITISDDSGTPITSVTINRRNPDGHTYPVRTGDGGPLTVTAGTATIYDYEPPYDFPITYSTDITGGPTATVELFITQPWLVHPGVPSRSQPIEFGLGSYDAVTRPIDQGTFSVLGRSTPIVATSGARTAPAGQFVLMTETAAQLAGLDLLFDDGSVLLLNVPADSPLGVGSAYIAVGNVGYGRPAPLGTVPDRTVTVPFQVVARPAGGNQASVTWSTVAAQYATWQAIIDAGVTSWAALTDPTG